MIEPLEKTQGPLFLQVLWLQNRMYEDPILLVAPSDHLIPDQGFFHELILKAIEEVNKDNIILFGIEPNRPGDRLWLFET